MNNIYYINRLFDIIDINKDGLLSTDELYNFMIIAEPSITYEDIEIIISNADNDNDGYINRDEFTNIVGLNITPEDIDNAYDNISINDITNRDLLTKFYNLLKIQPIYNHTNEEYIDILMKFIGNTRESFINFWNYITSA